MKLKLDDAEALVLGRAMRDSGKAMRNRRAITALALGASVPLAVIALWQTGAIRKIPEPKLPIFDAEKVNGSPQAYEKLQIPDGILGIGSLIATASLAAMGPPRRSRFLTQALAAKVALDATNAAKLTVDQWTKYRAFCVWCLLAAGATLAMLPFAWNEIRSSS